MIYSLNKSYPKPLPFRIALPDGTTRTDPTTFTEDEIASVGFVEVSDKPIIDTTIQKVRWDENSVSWVVEDLSQQELDVFSLENLNTKVRQWKNRRNELVRNIEVTHNEVVYQGDEVSQGRMSRTIIALPDDTTLIPWTSTDNTVYGLTRLDLKAILLDAGTKQAILWNDGRPV